MAVKGFSRIGICVRDLGVSADFYTEVLGFQELITVDFGTESESNASPAPGTSQQCETGPSQLRVRHSLHARGP